MIYYMSWIGTLIALPLLKYVRRETCSCAAKITKQHCVECVANEHTSAVANSDSWSTEVSSIVVVHLLHICHIGAAVTRPQPKHLSRVASDTYYMIYPFLSWNPSYIYKKSFQDKCCKLSYLSFSSSDFKWKLVNEVDLKWFYNSLYFAPIVYLWFFTLL